MSQFIQYAHIDTAPYEDIARFGYSIALFQQAHPDVHFRWGEVEYEDELGQDEIDELVANGEEIFEKDINLAVFRLKFETEHDRELYRAFDS